MPFLLPSNCSCYNLHLPQLDAQTADSMDECSIRRSTLDVRTGAATVLARSGIFVHGGLTIPLNLQEITSTNLQQELIMHFARERKDSNRFQNLGQWISKEVFFLDLISRRWERVETMPETDPMGNPMPRLTERLFHSVCYCQEAIFVFGGLTVSEQSDYEFISTNELWKLDLHNKVWSLISKDPSVTRRFNNQMHVLYESDPKKDTKLIIVGGLNNLDQPVETIDIFNLSTNCWETDVWDEEDDLHNITVNIGGKSVPLISENNFSLLVEENEAKLPSLAVYSPSIEESHDHDHEFKCNFNSEENPLFALPLMPDAEGARMHVYDDNDRRRKRLHIAYNLQWPTGDKFGYNIIISGFHPNLQSDNFHCFLYNITSGKWTRLSINCDDMHSSKHRFWKLFLWESHHKALLLGTKNDSGCLPSVQKFDRLLSFGLHITNLFHSAQRDQKSSKSSSAKKIPGSLAQTETDQFENYSRYVAPPSEITSIRSVFPSYSMVLGKDSLEVYNKLLADFEFITEDDESVAVPSFLLRKRWGRYFDMLLANAYVQVSTDRKIPESFSQISKLSSGNVGQLGVSPHTSSSISSIAKDDKKPTSQGSLDTFFSRHRPSAQSVQSSTPPMERKSACLFFNTPSTSKLTNDNSSHSIASHSDSLATATNANDRLPTSLGVNPDHIVSLGEISEQSSQRRHSNAASGVTSSSGGMVFRVPFRPSGESSKRSTPPPISLDPNDTSEPIKISVPSNRKNSASSYSALFTDDFLRSSQAQSRRISQSLGNDNLLHSSFGLNSPLSSRKASLASTSSSISRVSSSSDRMGESIYRSPGSEEILSLNVSLPPLLPVPSEPLPALPTHTSHDFSVDNRLSDHFFPDTRYRTSTSPLSSRRSSLHHDISQHISQENIYPNRIDEVFVGDPLHKPDNEADGMTTPQNERNSFASNTESLTSQTLNSGDVDFEPLFIPRSLYMPWPTETVKAFAEFFYTGQIDGKWPLSPVAVGLLNMAKIYEVPLLFDLMLEVFYSIIGKKEESLFVISKSLKDAFLNRVSLLFEDDQDAMQQYLENHKNYQEYQAIEKSLNSIDDGYFDIDHLRKASAAFSVSTVSSSATQDHLDKLNSFDSSSAPALTPSVITGSPRDSINSISSAHYPSTITVSGKKSSISHIQQRINTNPKHKSSLSKEVSTVDSPEILTRSSSPARPVHTTTEMHNIDDELDQVRDILEHDALEKSNTNDSSCPSDSDDLGVGLSLPSKSKIERSFRERALELEDSVDPLSRGSTESGSNYTKKPSLFSGKVRNDPPYHNQKLSTLDSLASPNSLPPVDYVMELIYESAVLVSDVKLMVRCKDCLHISKEIKTLKKKLAQDMSEIDDTLMKQRRQPTLRSITRPESQEQSPHLPLHTHSNPHLPSPSPSPNLKSFEKITKTISNLTIGTGRSKTNQSNKS